MLNLSFRISSAGWPKAIIIVVLVTAAVLAPIIYGVWWLHLGGAEYEHRKALESLRAEDPVEQAQKAIQKGDYKLYTTGDSLDRKVPGCGWANKDYGSNFGYRHLSIYKGKQLTEEEQELNQTALEYMSSYNRLVFHHVNEKYPDWRDAKF